MNPTMRPMISRIISAGLLTAARATCITASPVSSTSVSVPSMGFRLVALDMDGTALNKEHALSERTLTTLRSLSARGVSIALCSGRSIPAIREHAAHLNLDRALPVVAFNGACGVLATAPNWTDDADVLYTTPVPVDAVAKVLEVCEAAGLLVQYYVGSDIYVACKTEEHTELTRRYARLTGVPAHKYTDSYREAIVRGAPYKLLVMSDEADVDATLALLQSRLPPECVKLIRGSPPFFVEVLHPDVHKGQGLRQMCEALRIPLSEVAAFGDGDNDIEFLQTAGLGVAMSNARPTLLAVADRYTELPHDEDGVALALQKMEDAGELAVAAPRVVPLRASRAAAEGEDSRRRVVIRRVDAAEVTALRERVLWPGRPDKCVLAEDESPGAVHLAAIDEDASGDGGPADRVVGVLSLFTVPEGEATQPGGATAHFRKLATDPAWRSRGIGTALISTAAAEARCAGASTLVCDAREPQAPFYAALGFEAREAPFAKYGADGEMYVRMAASI